MNSPSEQFGQIYDQYIEKIYRFVYLKVNSHETAEDITSRVFLRGWETYRKNDTAIKNMNAFLYRVARNAVTDHYRDKGRTNLISADYSAEIIDKKTDLYQMALQTGDINVMKASIQNLKKDYQDVIIWHYLDDMSAEQIAQILDKPVGTIRVMLHRGLKSLKDELIEEA